MPTNNCDIRDNSNNDCNSCIDIGDNQAVNIMVINRKHGIDNNTVFTTRHDTLASVAYILNAEKKIQLSELLLLMTYLRACY